MQGSIAKHALLPAFVLAAPAAPAQDVAPEALLRAVTVKLIDKIRHDRDLQAADPGRFTKAALRD